jgi:hypothetical protein
MIAHYRIKPQVEDELSAYKDHLMALARLRMISADDALDGYLEACKQIAGNRNAFELDDRTYSPIKCRSCGRSGSAPDGVTKYSCKCSPTVAREAFLDMVDGSGAYLIGRAVALAKTDKMIDRAKALESGATLSEADELLG